MSYKILTADDEAEIRDLLRLYLENQGYEVIEAADGAEAVRCLELYKPDMCILDVMMPGTDGFHVLKKIRETSNIPVMMLSARDRDEDKILGLGLGADDYLSKPFNPLEAVARVNSAIRRYYSLGTGVSAADRAPSLRVRDLMLDTDACVLVRDGRTIDLTSVEYRIMKMFMESPGKVFTKQQIFEYGWNETCAVDDNSIMVCISKLRSKLDEDPAKYIRTIRGLGYRLEKNEP